MVRPLALNTRFTETIVTPCRLTAWYRRSIHAAVYVSFEAVMDPHYENSVYTLESTGMLNRYIELPSLLRV
jgi:hypothetical protein